MLSANIRYCHTKRREIEDAYDENGWKYAVEQFGGLGDVGSDHIQQHIHCKNALAIEI